MLRHLRGKIGVEQASGVLKSRVYFQIVRLNLVKMLWKPHILPSRYLLRRLAASSVCLRSAHHDHGHGHIDEEKVKRLMPIDKKNVKDPELLKHIEGYERVIRENYAEHPHSHDPWTLDPVKIANDPLHDLHGTNPLLWPATFNEYPLPTLPWAEAYARQQRNFNLALLVCATLFVVSGVIAWNHPVMQFHFHPPMDITDLDWNPDDDPDLRF